MGVVYALCRWPVDREQTRAYGALHSAQFKAQLPGVVGDGEGQLAAVGVAAVQGQLQALVGAAADGAATLQRGADVFHVGVAPLAAQYPAGVAIQFQLANVVAVAGATYTGFFSVRAS